MDGFFSAAEGINNYTAAVLDKAKMSAGKFFGKSIMAGGMIAIGAAASSVAAHGIDNVGIARLVAGTVFPVGLMMVILLGAELFTGDCMIITNVFKKQISAGKCLGMLGTVFVGNFLGSLLMAGLIYLSGQYNYSGGLLGAYTIRVALIKTDIGFLQGIASGIMCNIIVCAAVIMAGCAKDVSGKLLVSFFMILAFVTAGFEHCVANMYYITAGLLAKMNLDYVEAAKAAYGYTDAELAGLNIKTFLVNNMVPVTIGNIIGGAFFVGLPLYCLFNSKISGCKS